MSKSTICSTCGEPMDLHLRARKARICVAPIPLGETRESWIGLLMVRIQERLTEHRGNPRS